MAGNPASHLRLSLSAYPDTVDYTFIVIDLLGFISAVEKASPNRRLSMKVQISVREAEKRQVEGIKIIDKSVKKKEQVDCICVAVFPGWRGQIPRLIRTTPLS